jgi:hypothetical protein
MAPLALIQPFGAARFPAACRTWCSIRTVWPTPKTTIRRQLQGPQTRLPAQRCVTRLWVLRIVSHCV